MGRHAGTTRRGFLAGLGGGLAATTAGCTGFVGRTGADGDRPVSILAAGSLNDALENGLRPAIDADVQIEAHGSAEVARLVAEGQKDPDIVSLADTALFDSPLSPAWYVEFATNALVVAYDPESTGGERIERAGSDRWYEPILDGEASLGRTDPDTDPLGYRALFLLELATDYYDSDVNLREAIPDRGQIYPETQLISVFETGSIDAAIAYRNMAVERGYAYVELPPQIDLSDPEYEPRYASAAYRLPSGKTVRGSPVSYGSTIREGRLRTAVANVFDEHVAGDYLADFGFGVPANYPRYTGDVPDELTE